MWTVVIGVIDNDKYCCTWYSETEIPTQMDKLQFPRIQLFSTTMSQLWWKTMQLKDKHIDIVYMGCVFPTPTNKTFDICNILPYQHNHHTCDRPICEINTCMHCKHTSINLPLHMSLSLGNTQWVKCQSSFPVLLSLHCQQSFTHMNMDLRSRKMPLNLN